MTTVNHYTTPTGQPLDLCDACAALAAPLTLVGEGGPGLTCQHCLGHNPDDPTPPPAVALPDPESGAPFAIVLRPDHAPERLALPGGPGERLGVLQEAVGGHIEYLSPAFHGLDHWDVVMNEDGADRLPPNPHACAVIGFDLGSYRPLCGPLVLVPREGGAGPDRVRDAAFFENLRMVLEGGMRVGALGVDFVIDARGEG